MKPVDFYVSHGWLVTSPYGWRTHPITGVRSHHNGIDFAGVPAGHPVATPYPGLVTAAQFYPSRGNTVAIRMPGGIMQLFQHLQGFRCRVGDRVAAGTDIGLNGSTGDSTGPHLHYELRQDGVPWGAVWGDPAKFEMEVKKMIPVAVLLNTLADAQNAEPLVNRLGAAVILRSALKTDGTGILDNPGVKRLIVCGGGVEGLKAEEIVNLSGDDRWYTAENIGRHFRGLR